MRVLRVLARRVALGLASAWAILTTIFAMFTLTDDWVLGAQVGRLRWVGAGEQAVQAARESYLSARGLDRPLEQVYVDWLGNMATLDWGQSFESGAAVLPMVADATARTAMYVLPALVLAVAAGLGVGLYAALNPRGRLAELSLVSTYLVFAVPNFWLGGMLAALAGAEVIAVPPLFVKHILPIALTTTTLLGGYVSYTRAYATEFASTDFVKLVRAKGARRLRVGAHVIRNAAIPVLSMVFTEALGLLLLTVFVIERLFGIPGFGTMLLGAVEQRDVPVLLGSTVVISAVGVVGSIVQDLSYGYLDPRVD
ncbi:MULTISPECIES: ABC transporter permease [Salinibaculum]|uniref:ABC transporter permease n=1 Tax=Salinibaculum TaxID=2732368 RepID=UPI0030D0E42B